MLVCVCVSIFWCTQSSCLLFSLQLSSSADRFWAPFEWWCTEIRCIVSFVYVSIFLSSFVCISIIFFHVWMINWMRNICGSIKTRTCKHQDNLGTIVSAKRFSARHHIAQVRFFFVVFLFYRGLRNGKRRAHVRGSKKLNQTVERTEREEKKRVRNSTKAKFIL